MITQELRTLSEGNDGGERRVLQRFGLVGQTFIQDGECLSQMAKRCCRSLASCHEILDERGAEQYGVQIRRVAGHPLEPEGSARVIVYADLGRVDQISCNGEV